MVPEICVVVVAIDLDYNLINVPDKDTQKSLSVIVVFDVCPLPLQTVLKLYAEVHMTREYKLAFGLRVPKIRLNPVHLVIELRALVRIPVILVQVHDSVEGEHGELGGQVDSVVAAMHECWPDERQVHLLAVCLMVGEPHVEHSSVEFWLLGLVCHLIIEVKVVVTESRNDHGIRELGS
jgi:hypothetical protein